MKKGLFFFFILLLVHLTVNAQTRDYTFRNAAPDEGLMVVQNTRSGMQMRHALKQISIVNITDNGFTGDVVLGGKGISLPANEGEPSLPAYSNFVAIPNGATAHIEMGYRSMTTIENVDLLPAAPLKADTDDSPNTYEKNPSIYNKNAFFPERPVTVSEPFSLRGVQTVAVSVVPYQYNPITKELRVYDDLQFDVRFDGGNGEFGDSRLRSPYWDPILMQSLANYNQLPTVDYEARMQQWVNNRTTGCEYLIVIPNNESFRTYANQLRDYRIQQGILTEVKSLSEMGCTTIDQMKSYFHNAYNTWDIPPVAVLLLGDHNTNMSSGIPAETVSHPSTTTCISDNGYADVNGDLLPDMVFSRLVAASASEAQMMVSKQIEYEYTNPNMNASSYDHPVTALGWQTDRWFQLCSEVVGGYWRQKGKHPVRINEIYNGTPGSIWSTNDNTYSVVMYFGPNGTGYIPETPAELGGWSGGTAAQITQAFNSGAMLVQHRDHGAYNGWGEPDFRISNVSDLTNVGKLTFVNTINCKTGAFNYSSGCFIEALMRHTYNNQNAGAVGCLGPTETSYSFCNDAFAWGMYDHFDPQFMPTFGPFADYESNWRPAFGNVAGKYFLQQSSWPYNASQKGITYKMFTAHCDAFLMLYTQVPTAMTVTHPTQVTATTTNLTLTAPAGAVVALTRNNQILAVTTATGNSQSISFAAQPASTTITVVATKQDHLRYVSSINVVNGNSYEITAVANPEEGGIVEGAGNYAANTQCVLNATANDGYDFANWASNGVEVSTDATYAFNVTASGVYTANFTLLLPHSIQCEQMEHGSVSADKSTALKYDTVRLTSSPVQGYCFSEWDVRDANNNSISVFDNCFIMPDNEVTVSAVFLPGKVVSLAPVEHGRILANPIYALSGTVISLTAKPDPRYAFAGWTVYKTEDASVTIPVEDNHFVMPDFDVTVSAVFVQGVAVTVANTLNGSISADVSCAPSGTLVTLSATPAKYYYLYSWNVFKSDDMSITVPVTDNQFVLPSYDVTVTGVFHIIETEQIPIGISSLMSSKVMPSFTYRNYSTAQEIYTAEEIGAAGTITAMALKIDHFENDSIVQTCTRKIDIYLRHTNKGEFVSKTNWDSLTVNDKVFSGNVTFTVKQWKTITFSQPFEYDGNSNLLVCIDDNSKTWSSKYAYFSIYATGSNRALYRYSDDYNMDPIPVAHYYDNNNAIHYDALNYLMSNNQVIFTMTHSGSNAALAVAPGQAEFSCVEGEGSSEPLLVNVVGSLLDGNVTLTMSGPFEVSSSVDGPYSPSFVLNESNGNVDAVVYVRFKSGLCQGRYEGTMTLTSGEHELTANLNGEVFGKLVAGWNWWAPTKSMSLADLKQALGTSGTLINSQNAGFLRYENNTWSGTLTNLSLGQMYRIQASAPVALKLSGMPASDVSVNLTQGYNWFGYTGAQPLALENLNITPGPAEGDKINSQSDGFAIYENGAWSGSLTMLLPGRGYVYMSNGTENKTIIFP